MSNLYLQNFHMNTVESKVRSLFTLLWYPFYEESMPCASSEIDNILCQNEISTSVTDSSKAHASHVNTCHIRMSSWIVSFPYCDPQLRRNKVKV